ncbi:MAG: beta-Ala-His dipeptidase [Promethearchaeota archaeon]
MEHFNIEKLGNPQDFWYYFQEITKIPRCSGHEDKIRNFVQKEAEQFGFKTKIDKIGNSLVRIKGNSKKKPIILQSHLDMVCEKIKGSNHDFSKDPLKLKIVDIDGNKWLKAKNTTLGADNGVGIAFQLALMKQIKEGKINFNKCPLDLLFTVNEESSMFGAFQLEKSMIEGDFLINLDGFEDSTIIVGNVGGTPIQVDIRVEFNKLNNDLDDYISFKLQITGLIGGHSALDIDKGRLNAIILMGKLLNSLNHQFHYHLESIEGGDKMNSIPRECTCIIHVKKTEGNELNEKIHNFCQSIKEKFSEIEKNINISVEKLNLKDLLKSITEKEKEIIIQFLINVINGPVKYHHEMKNLLYSSTNLSSITTKNRSIKITFMARSFDLKENEKIALQIKELLKNLNSRFKLNFYEGYGAWAPEFDSHIVNVAKKTYKQLFKEELNVTALHATLENGIFKQHYPHLQMITYGPTGLNAHSPEERLEIRSVEKSWKFLIQLIKNLSLE